MNTASDKVVRHLGLGL